VSSLNLKLPDSLHRHIEEFSQREGVSINQFVATAVAEKMSALTTEDYLEKRAKRGNKQKLKAILSQVPNVEPGNYDQLPS
jgi:hypothetical protein